MERYRDDSEEPQDLSRPNIIIVMADDMGFSDIGCFGSEISTPNIDALGNGGMRFTQMYNGARCCPSRASLLTGLHPHQAGIGHMVYDLGKPEYQGYLNDACVTMAEVLGTCGYTNLMSGKWHVGGGYDHHNRDEWTPGAPGRPLPRQRGFDEYFGLLNGADTYWNPVSLMLGDTLIDVETDDFHLTDAITDHAVSQIESAVEKNSPFFQYVAYTAPHWPLHAYESDIARYEGKYLDGWDVIRGSRHESQKGMGIVDEKWPISPRDIDSPPWDQVKDKEWEDIRMATYAAMIEQLDRGVGRIVETLKCHGVFENTLIMFLSDNGGCAEIFQEDSNQREDNPFRKFPTRDGQERVVGDIPGLRPGPDTTFQSVELPWANVSDTPFRLFKRWTHEGGISSPFVAHWPRAIEASNIRHEPLQIIDIAATVYEAANAHYPSEFGGHEITPIEGQSFLPLLTGSKYSREKPMFIEHEGNRLARMGAWKLVAEWDGDWELYNIDEDRTELKNMADSEPERVNRMKQIYHEWAKPRGVLPWPFSDAGRGRRFSGPGRHGDAF